ncbi:MAG: DUF554 domain-containing protein [Clostridiaceae bacterium]|nr:DUF554 domain-containing protein [Clostridiaceae bacterium]
MTGIGTIVNTAAILVGGGLGLLLKKGIPDRFQKIVFTATGTGTFLLGIMGVITASVTASADGTLSSTYALGLILALVLGGVLGELLRIDRGFDRLGELLRHRVPGGAGAGDASGGFAEATILFCSGAMAILGAIQDGAQGDPSMLYTKAVLDGVTALIFATVYGSGVLFSAASVLVYQGVITAAAGWLAPRMAPEVITQMSMVGSAILMLIAFSLWNIRKFNIANLIPAAFMPILFSAVIALLHR